jgi:hypothetical protein
VTRVNSLQVLSSTIDSTPIGGASPSTAQFTTPATADRSLNAATTAWVANALQGVQSAAGYVTLPGGIMIQWGTTGTLNNNTPTTVSFNVNFPTNVFLVLGSASGNRVTTSSGVQPAGAAANGTLNTFTANAPATNVQVSWIAIGN